MSPCLLFSRRSRSLGSACLLLALAAGARIGPSTQTAQGADPVPGADIPANETATTPQTALSAAKVARELLQLQQQQGGSIVYDRPGLAGWPVDRPALPTDRQVPVGRPLEVWDRDPEPATPSSPRTPPRRSLRRSAPSAVDSLRAASWQLETTAHRLEKLDLYNQADALRELAHQLRLDARTRQQEARRRRFPQQHGF